MEKPTKTLNWIHRKHGKDKGLEMNQPREGGGEGGPPMVRPHPSAGTPP